MSVFRVNKTSNYTVMSNLHLRDKTISLKAKGLLSFMLSLPDTWDYSMYGLCKINKENIKAIRSTLQELEEHKYLKRERIQNEKGRFEYNYFIHEEPYDHSLHTDKGNAQEEIQINTNKTSKKEIIDKVDKTWNPITLELVRRNYLTEDHLELYKYDNLIEEMLEQYDYRDVMMATNYVIQKWKENQGLDENDNPITNQYGYFKSALQSNLRKLTEEIELWEIEP